MDKIFDSNIHLAGGSAWRSVSGFDLDFLKKTLLKSVSSLGGGHIRTYYGNRVSKKHLLRL